MRLATTRIQGLLLLFLTIIFQQADGAQSSVLNHRANISFPESDSMLRNNIPSFIPLWPPGKPTTRQPVERICLEFSSEVPAVLRAETMTLLSHVPNLVVGGTCNGENDLVMAVSVNDELDDEEILLHCPAQDGARRLRVMSGGGHGAKRPIGIAMTRALRLLGFAFLHPLSPNVPGQASLPIDDIDIRETPHLSIRGIHLHTMHPIEFTDFLNGWGPEGIDDDEGFHHSFPAWKNFLMWMHANGLNRVQWVLLWNEQWAAFGDSSLRQSRLKEIVGLTHAFGIEAGIDAPVSFQQQNAFRLIRDGGDIEMEKDQIRTHVDYLMKTDIDFLALEIGTTEFSHAPPKRILARLNYIASYLDDTYRKRATVKVHVSSGQRTDGWRDPVDGKELNVNFIPWYADKRLGVMPHSVAYYGLSDPAPVYGNANFAHIARYIQREIGRREVLWYPETAYWCSFDVDVPLFLPLYAERRMNDLRFLARQKNHREDRMGIDGQVIFSSGWEWAYWLGDVVAAQAAWDPMLEIPNDDDAFVAMLQRVLAVFEESAYALATQLAEVAFKERSHLITGKNDIRHTIDNEFDSTLTGQAYLEGIEPLDEMVAHLNHLPGATLTPTQPDRISLLNGNDSRTLTGARINQVSCLLSEMKLDFATQQYRLTRLAPAIDRDALEIYHEFVDALHITALRAEQIQTLYTWKLAQLHNNVKRMTKMATRSIEIMNRAKTVVHNRELFYRTPVSQIATWRGNPTAYGFGYLWTVHSLYFWHRDHLRIAGEDPNPCAANIYDPFLLAFGQTSSDSRMGKVLTLLSSVTTLNWHSCLEISVPPDW